MTVWFTSDLHFGHINIIRYTGRPFADVDTMNEALIQRWNELVRERDTVWVLGDVAMGHIAETLPLVGRLAGRKLLVAGNHDRCWAGHGPRAVDWQQRYLDAGFDEIHQGTIHVALGDLTVLAGHFPYEGDTQGEDRYPEARPVDRGEWLLHGHVHTEWRQHERMINVGCDAWDCRPVVESTLLDMIAAGPNDLAPLRSAT